MYQIGKIVLKFVHKLVRDFTVSFMGWKILQIDVKTTFLNGIIEEEVIWSSHRDLK